MMGTVPFCELGGHQVRLEIASEPHTAELVRGAYLRPSISPRWGLGRSRRSLSQGVALGYSISLLRSLTTLGFVSRCAVEPQRGRNAIAQGNALGMKDARRNQ